MGLRLDLKAANGGDAKLCTIVVRKSSMSCGISGLCFSACFRHLGLSLGLGFGFGLGFESRR